ncbi:MAG: hypothetical protein GXP42_19205 [Chloroflexi bacterium]|nr:hypothetical protein [Chloroflexota bacterium]
MIRNGLSLDSLPAGRESVRGWRRAVGWRGALVAAIVTLAALLALARLDPFVAAYGDEARFLMVGQSLRFEGRYEIGGYIGSPAETQYPPGMPVLDALAMWLTGTGQPLVTAIVPAKILVLLLYLLSLPFLYDLLRRYGPEWMAFATLLFVAVHPLISDLATQPMTDVPFLAFSILALWMLERASDKGGEQRERIGSGMGWAAAAGLMAAAAINFRLAGVMLVAAGGLFLLLRRRWLASALFVLIPVLSLAPWLLFAQAVLAAEGETEREAGGSIARYAGALVQNDLYEGEASRSDFKDMLIRWSIATRTYTIGLSKFLFEQPWRRIEALSAWHGKIDALVGLLLAPLILLGAILGARGRRWLPVIYFVGAQLMLLAWPFFQTRHVLPVLPFYFFFLLLALDGLRKWGVLWNDGRTIGRRDDRGHRPISPLSHGLESRRTRRWERPVWLAMIVLTAFTIFSLAAVNIEQGVRRFALRDAPNPQTYYEALNPEWARYFEAAAWVSERMASDEVLMARKPYLVFLYYNVPAMAPLWSPDPDQWPPYLREKGVDYLIEDAFTWSDATDRFLRPALRAYEDQFELLYETSPPITRVWRYVGEQNAK